MVLAQIGRKPCLFLDMYSKINKALHILSQIAGSAKQLLLLLLQALTKESDKHTFELTVFVLCFMVKTLT
jgi:hypothetical protein